MGEARVSSQVSFRAGKETLPSNQRNSRAGENVSAHRCGEGLVQAFLEILFILPVPPSFSRGKNKYRHPRLCQSDGCVHHQCEKLCPEAELDNQTKPPCQ